MLLENKILFHKPNNIQVAWSADRSELVVWLPFKEKTSIYKLPEDTPPKDTFTDLVLHQSDLKIANEYLRLISNDQNVAINEALFVAALNIVLNALSVVKADRNSAKKKFFKTNLAY